MMNVMKKLVSVFLAGCTLAGFCACGAQGDTSVTTTTEAPATVEPNPVIEPNELLAAAGEGITTCKNPIISVNNKYSSHAADPFVMRWNGNYYLYHTYDGALKCWTSKDLVNWVYKGACSTDRNIVHAYAPEVYYYNGYFYMYTSPAGNGHFILRSSSPTGPFKAVTKNLGLSIDGSVFIDDNGKWYFYSASGSGIMCYSMTSPTDINPSGSTCGASMSGWTEGPMVVKYDGMYYLTYTGNHFLSAGYRINYATSTSRPTNFKASVENPVLINTNKSEVYGIGHSSTVLGPNMDSYYLVYHSMTDNGNRDMRIDRIVFNGSDMTVLGATITDQQVPEMPDVYNMFDGTESTDGFTVVNGDTTGALTLSDGGYVLSDMSFSDDYTAEVNIKSIDGGVAGAYFSYTDDNNYGTAYFYPDSQELVVTFVVGGESTEYRSKLVKSFNENVDFSALHTIMIRKSGNEYTFYVDGRSPVKYESALKSGKIGAKTSGGSAKIGFIGCTGDVWQSSIKTFYKPVEGTLEAITCVEKQITTTERSGVTLVTMTSEKILNYYVNVAKAGKYDLSFYYRSETDTVVEVYSNKTLIATVTVPATGKTTLSTYTYRGLEIPNEGFSVLSFKVTSGTMDVKNFNFYKVSESYSPVSFAKPLYKDGDITSSGGVITGKLGKALYGDYTYGDCEVEATFKCTDINAEFGIVARADNPAIAGANDDVNGGLKFIQGYYACLSGLKVTLYRMNYEATDSIQAYRVDGYSIGDEITLKIEAVGSDINVYANGELIISYTDTAPFVQGAAAVMVKSSATVTVSDLTVTTK